MIGFGTTQIFIKIYIVLFVLRICKNMLIYYAISLTHVNMNLIHSSSFNSLTLNLCECTHEIWFLLVIYILLDDL